MSKKFDPYKPGEIPGRCNIRILKLLKAGDSMMNTVYQTQYVCCEEVIVQTHTQINKRINDAIRKRARLRDESIEITCLDCRDGKRNKRKFEKSKEVVRATRAGDLECNLKIQMPMWNPPQSVKEKIRSRKWVEL